MSLICQKFIRSSLLRKNTPLLKQTNSVGPFFRLGFEIEIKNYQLLTNIFSASESKFVARNDCILTRMQSIEHVPPHRPNSPFNSLNSYSKLKLIIAV